MVRNKARILDELLVRSARMGDAKAFGLLARRWQRKLLAHAWRMTGDPDLAPDAVQSAWSEIVRGIRTLRDDRAFPAWAFRIVSRVCSQQIKDAVHRRHVAAELAAQPEGGSEEGTSDRDMERLRAAIGSLPAEQRSAIALFHLEGLSVAEVAVALEVPSGTVKTRLMHARRKLRSALEEKKDA